MATSAQVQQLYITYFGRPADPSGLAYWTADEATPLAEIANGFATTPEFAADIEGQSLDFIVNSFYVDLFGRNAEPEGLAFWVNQIQIGNTTIQAAGLDIGNAALEVQNTGNADNVALNSKITASQQWTETVAASTEGILAYSGQTGIDAGVNYLLPVLTTATIPTEEATQAQIDLLILENGNGGTDTLALSIFRDVVTAEGTLRLDANGSIQGESSFSFTAGNQVVNGTAQTFSGLYGGDSLVDSSTLDSDRLNVTGITDFTNFGAGGGANGAVVQNIEEVNIELNGANNVFTNVTAASATFTNAQVFNIAGTVNGQAGGITTTGSGATTINTSLLEGTNNNDRFAIVDASGNNLSVTAGDLNTNITLGGGNDTITSGSGDDNLIAAGAGNDVVDLGGGANTFQDAGDGNDTVTHGAGTIAITVTGAGLVTLNASATGATSTSTAGINTNVDASGSTAAVVLNGASGRDTLEGGSGSDDIDGGTAADLLTGNQGIDRFTQSEGDSVANTALTNGGNAATDNDAIAGSVWTFGNGVDIITDFSTVDTLRASDIFAANTLPTVVAAQTFGDITDNTAYIVYGTYTAAGTFTAAAAFNAVNANDALLTYSDAADVAGATNSTSFILTDLTAALAAGNFVA